VIDSATTVTSIVGDLRRAAAPAAAALDTPLGVVSFGELLARVDGLAGALRARGVGPGAWVAVYLERSAEMIIGLLGVLACGAGYVPLDPEYPSARHAHLLDDSRPAVLLGRADADALLAGRPIARLDPDDWPRTGAALPAPDDGPAYVMYTSGSTGKPKGAVIEHAALRNYLSWCLRTLPFRGGGVPLLNSISFDHAVTTLFPPLLRGEPLVLLPPVRGGRALADSLLTGRRYSYVKLTPSHVRMLDLDQRAELGCSADLIMLGGERFPGELVDHLRRDRPDVPIMNHYGPTEATVGCCTYDVPLGFHGAAVPIGRPIPGVTLSVRREDGSVAEAGEVGELHIAGAGLAREYWMRPELTARAFVSLPDETGALRRHYRTGDLARRRADGLFEHLGRVDDQVKILGHRIEPMEIEAVLRSHRLVADAAVMPLERGGDVELAAAVVVRGEAATENELRRYVRAHLPGAMVPARVLLLPRLPVTANGKLDRTALLAALAAPPPPPDGNASIEDDLAVRWREVLGRPEVGRDDDFFDMGGDSLATVEIATWASNRFRINLDPFALFECPTIRSLADRIRALSPDVETPS
jgi:amino acid adenylation domain-containing protein